MFIKEIVIDGFKSYATRTVISGWDPAFNAITGLNGSGKSNVLDAICFVLGISNLSQVRAASLTDLVYKSGQSGVTKATVSIVFDNSDAKASPIGYEHLDTITVTRTVRWASERRRARARSRALGGSQTPPPWAQIIIGGRNKYLINGHAVQAAAIVNLFHSVQLNVNNPHFLIMQVRAQRTGGGCVMERLAAACRACAKLACEAAHRRPRPHPCLGAARRAASPRC
jgi:structural maintenance of chromosome 2